MNTVICIDAGHGGIDSGCIFADRSYEKTYNLKLAVKIYNIIYKYYKDTFIDRTKDKDNELPKITNFFNSYTNRSGVACKVDAYSFHCNACDKHNARGSEILLSINENRKNTDWSIYVLKEFEKKFGLKSRGVIKKKGSSGLDYYYLHRKSNKNVSVKIWEIGFGDNKSDLNIMKTHIDDIAFFIAREILLKYNIDIKKNDNVIYTYSVQCGHFNREDNAIALQKKLIKAGFDAIIEKEKK
jgi:N-acetylmuramoyl-L-alanine amidase